MHHIDAQPPGHCRNLSLDSCSRPSRSPQATQSTGPDIVLEDISPLLRQHRSSQNLSSSAVSFDNPRFPTATQATPSSNGHDGPHLRPTVHSHETTDVPLLPLPDHQDHLPTECRKKSDLTTIGQAILDICITATSLYFLAFAIAASVHRGELATSGFANSLLQAARFV